MHAICQSQFQNLNSLYALLVFPVFYLPSKNVNSLVGVAISASLLPPAVNTGLCLSMALVGPTVVNFHVDVRAKTFDAIAKAKLTGGEGGGRLTDWYYCTNQCSIGYI